MLLFIILSNGKKHIVTHIFVSLGELQQLVRSILTLTLSAESVESQTSIFRRKSAHLLEVVPEREDIVGPSRPSAETRQEPAEWDISNMSTEEKRTLTDMDVLPKAWRTTRSERLSLHFNTEIHCRSNVSWGAALSALVVCFVRGLFLYRYY